LIDDVTGGRDEPKRPIAPRRRGLGKGLDAILPSPGQPDEPDDQQSQRDQLTGLANRSLLDERFDEAAARCREDGASLAVLLVALDGFSEINEVFGHRVGDDLLHDAAARLSGARRTSDTVARFAGDEFVVVCPFVLSAEVACRMAQGILDDLGRPVSVDGVEHQLSASIGVVVTSPRDAYDRPPVVTQVSTGDTSGDPYSFETLLGQASLAMRHAKDAGGGSWRLFDPTMREHVVVRSQSRQDLRAAMEEGGLVLEYEPIVDVVTGYSIGESARLGWRVPAPEADQPQALLDVADEAGLAGPLGRWVLDQALADLNSRHTLSSLPEHFRIWVKVAPSLVADPAFVGTVDELTAKHRVTASRLGLDVREPAPAAVASTEATLEVLAERDVGVAIDDYGVGPSNIALLQRLPITGLKLAPELVEALGDADPDRPARNEPVGRQVAVDVPTGHDAAALVRALIELGHALDLTVVAQGVESQAQLEMLRALGCEYAQGPFLDRGGDTPIAPEVTKDMAADATTETATDVTTDTAADATTGIAPAAPPAPVAATDTPRGESLWATGTTPGGTTPGGTTPGASRSTR
jgi:diguanylate cyclase (GGDEF)-like protein